jgi:hypothetical protein
MPKTSELSTSQLRQALQLREQIESLQERLEALLGGSASPAKSSAKVKAAAPAAPKRRTMSAATRAKMRAAQQARWGAVKAEETSPAKSKAQGKGNGNGKAKAGGGAAKSNAPTEKKRTMTPEGRAKIAAAMKARWAARKSADSANIA